MKILLSVFFLITYQISQSQTIDYNTQKGYLAEGYDIVAYFENKALEGNKKFKATYDGVDLLFSSEENLKKFNDHPEKFLPQYGGYCAYAIAENSKKVKIDPETFEIRDGKLYLFYNSWGNNTLKSWLKNDVKGLQKKADKNWEAIKIE